jgi:hypothetical protein
MRLPKSLTMKTFRCYVFVTLFCGVLLVDTVHQVSVTSTAIAGKRRACLQLRFRRLSRRNACPSCCTNSSALPQDAIPAWQPLFDGESLAGWKITNFGGEGEVYVEKERLMLEFGSSLTGITYSKEFPKTNYEVRLDAMQVDGIDFFCGMTFPVGDSHCSFIVGGWAGAVVGLSNIDDRDASENETTKYMTFKNGVWYRIRLRVTPDRITAWIDDKKMVDQVITGRKISTRPETDLSKPFGIASWDTRAALRNIEVRRLTEK